MFHAAEEGMKLHVICGNAYEDVDPHRKFLFLAETLMLAAWNTELPDIEERLRNDKSYARILTEAVSDCADIQHTFDRLIR